MGKLGLNSGYIGSDQRTTRNGVVGYDKFYLERRNGRFFPVLEGDPDAEAFFQRVVTAGGTLSATEQFATNQLVLDLKSYGIWTAMKAIYPMVGASAAACAQNLKSSSFTGTFNGGITYSNTGVQGNATTGFYNTGLKPSVDLSLDSTHISFYCNQVPTLGNSNLMGVRIGSNAFLLITPSYPRENGDFYTSNNSTEVLRGKIINTNSGFFINTRTNSTTSNLFRNTTKYSYSDTSGALSIGDIHLLGANAGGSSTFRHNGICAFASIGDGLTDTEASDFYDAVQAFNTTLSRQV
jgi:hypothetical protein